MHNKPKKTWILAFGLIALLAGLRLVHLSADSPVNLHWGRGAFTDEAFYAHNARNKILFKAWSTDEFNYHLLSPVMSGLDYLAFSLGGVRYTSIRLVSIIASVITLLFLFMWLKKHFAIAVAFSGTAFLGLNYFYLMHSRLALSEVPMLMALMISFYFLTLGKRYGYFVAGLFFGLAVLTKSLAGFFGALVLFYLYGDERKKFWSHLGMFMLPLVAVGIGTFFLLVFPNPQEYLKSFAIFVGQRTPKRLLQVMKVFHTEFFAQLPATTVFTLASLWFYQGFSAPEKNIALWWWVGLIYLSVWSYTTAAYYLILIIPMSVLSALFLYRMYKGFSGQEHIPSWFFRGIWFFCSYLMIRYILLFYWRDTFFAVKINKVILEIITLSLLSLLWTFLAETRTLRLKKISIAAFSLFLVFDFLPFIRWVVRPAYTVQCVGRDMQKIVGTGTVAGPWSPALCLETRTRAFPFWENVVNDKNLDRRTDIDYLLLERSYLELDFIKRVYPNVLQNAELLKTYHVDNRLIDLWGLTHGGS